MDIQYALVSIIGGICSKLYDDINDNKLLEELKKKKVLLEFLKSTTLISITGVSIKYPIVLLLLYMGCIVQHITDKSGPFKDPYEKSLLYSTLFIFFLINYKDIRLIKTPSSKNLILSGLVIISVIFYGLSEAFVTEEVSHTKIYTRLLFLFSSIVFIVFFPVFFNRSKFVVFFMIGYFVVSIIVQYYSLFVYQPKQNNKKLKFNK